MARYLLRRLLHAIFVVWGAATLVFAILHFAPGDPAVALVGENATDAQFEQVRRSLGLDLPLHERYLRYLGELVSGDLGTSWFVGQPVLDMLAERLPDTIELTLVAAILCIPLAVALGVVSAVWRRTTADYAANAVALFGVATPNFWLGVMLILLFSVQLHWLPSMGRGPSFGEAVGALAGGRAAPLGDWAAHIVLPAVTLGTFLMALVTRLTRTDILENLSRPYVKVARAKGMSHGAVIVRHVLPNSLISVVTFVGLEVGTLLGGAVVTETIFAWPGMGRLMIESIQRRDYPVVQGGVLLVSFIFVFVNLLVDLLYVWLDPRIPAALMARVLDALRRNPMAMLALAIVAALIAMVLFAPWIAPHEPEKFALAMRNRPPAFLEGGSWSYLLGTDTHGRDVLSRIIHGARVSLGTAVAGVTIAVVIGVTLGMIAGFFGGLWDTVIMRFVDILLSIPLILMALLVVAVLGSRIENIIMVMGGVGWIWHARIVRGNTLRIREEQYVLAAISVGTTSIGIMRRHILPNLLAAVLVTASMQVGYMVILESGLSFFGITGTSLSWGWDISFGRRYLASAWWISTFPGLAIFLTVLAFNLLGDFLRDLADPHERR